MRWISGCSDSETSFARAARIANLSDIQYAAKFISDREDDEEPQSRSADRGSDSDEESCQPGEQKPCAGFGTEAALLTFTALLSAER